jgi:hypothetical protein
VVLVAAAALRLMQERDGMEDDLQAALARVDEEFAELRAASPGLEDSVDQAHREVRCQFIQRCRQGQAEMDRKISEFMARNGLSS